MFKCMCVYVYVCISVCVSVRVRLQHITTRGDVYIHGVTLATLTYLNWRSYIVGLDKHFTAQGGMGRSHENV